MVEQETIAPERIRRAFDTYDAQAQAYIDRYESLVFEDVHADILNLLPSAPARVLDVGAGSGRDAARLARLGYDVVAVEPSVQMRLGAKHLHREPNIVWLDDALPDLSCVNALDAKLDFILLSAVWMHLSHDERPRAFRSLVDLLAVGGRLAISLRLGSPEPARAIYAVNTAEMITLAEKYDLKVLRVASQDDRLQRANVQWASIVMERVSK